ncbi:MAG: excinuclease ABC subunit UvrC [Mycoplasmataceae bacterium]|jgi:excinuclease ABC subunit C|nr:excinuclease ABC subunit UvrC [Mycoplasmataceae bacterium]
MNEQLEYKLSNIPKLPGVYIWKDKYEQIIYIGKATNLYNRTHQYFDKDKDIKTSALVKNIYDVDFIVTNTENESLILENDLISKHKPRYNMLLRYGSGYPYIIVTKEKNPRIIYTKNPNIKGYRFGPFASSKIDKYQLYNLLNRIFPLRKCNPLKKQKCLYYDIGQCLGPCINNIVDSSYTEIIENIKDFFSGKTSKIISDLKTKEKVFSQNLQYEEANKVKEQINSIKELTEKQIINISDSKDIDIVGFSTKDNYITIVIFSYQNGKLVEKNQQIGELFGNIEDTVTNYLMQFYYSSEKMPKKIYLNISDEATKQLETVLKTSIVKPISGKFKTIVLNAINNSIEFFKSNYLVYRKKIDTTINALNELKEILGIDNLNLINVFDMSNLFGTEKIGAMIAMQDYQYNKSLYRKFLIKNENAKGDTELMRETVYRNYSKSISQESQLPNLIIVDGGINQINATIDALKELKIDSVIPVIGLSKDDKHKTNEIVFPSKKKYQLDHKSNLYMFLLNLQEEVHRFAITFFRNRRGKSSIHSILNTIDGLGPKGIEKLITTYDNINNIMDAPINELTQIVNKKTALKIKETLSVHIKNNT